MDQELVEKFMEITGESETIACQYLSLADGNVEMAVTLMFEAAQVPESQSMNADSSVRPPILPTQEVLVASEPMFSFPRLTNSVFDRFRDFAVETQRQEEEMTRRVSGAKQISQQKTKRLEDLFRPPSNILFLGTFIDAREHAKALNRWLLVNVQNPQEFVCQVLNRDVWSNEQIQEIVKDHFILWQVLSNTSDGKSYIDFYKVVSYPYLAVIDPRTGECIRMYNHITVDSLMSDLNDILSTHASPEGTSAEVNDSNNSDNHSMPPVEENCLPKDHGSCSQISKTSKYDTTLGSKQRLRDSCESSNNNTFSILNKRRRLDKIETEIGFPNVELSNKVQEQNIVNNETATSKTDIHANNEPLLRLCLRLPNGDKETISMCATNTIEDFLQKVEDMGYPSSDYAYLVPFPKTNIGMLPTNTCLSDTILFPSNTIFIMKT